MTLGKVVAATLQLIDELDDDRDDIDDVAVIVGWSSNCRRSFSHAALKSINEFDARRFVVDKFIAFITAASLSSHSMDVKKEELFLNAVRGILFSRSSNRRDSKPPPPPSRPVSLYSEMLNLFLYIWLLELASLGSSSGMLRFMPTAKREFLCRVDGKVCKISFVTSERKLLNIN